MSMANAPEVASPMPLKVAVVAPLPLTAAFGEPSALERSWTMRGSTVSDAATLHFPAGSSMLTTQFGPSALRAQSACVVLTRLKRTIVFLRTASALASMRPF